MSVWYKQKFRNIRIIGFNRYCWYRRFKCAKSQFRYIRFVWFYWNKWYNRRSWIFTIFTIFRHIRFKRFYRNCWYSW